MDPTQEAPAIGGHRLEGLGRLGKPRVRRGCSEIGRLGDRELVDFAVARQVDENLDRVDRLCAVARFHDRRAKERPQPGENRRFLLTPLQVTAVEMAPVLGVSEKTIEIWIDLVARFTRLLPNIWKLCLSGRLDLSRAQLVLEAAEDLADEADVPAFEAAVLAYLARYDDPASPLVTVNRGSLARAVRYRKSKFPQRSAEESFHAAFAKRKAVFHSGDNGVGHLGATGMVTDLMAADYRLTLIAKRLCQEPGETRTLDQMRADVLLDLVLGRLTVPASTGALEHADPADSGEGPDAPGGDGAGGDWYARSAVGKFARPVINVTVSLETLAGFSDDPGTLAGAGAIPPELARLIAAHPGSTWYRMLTDDRRECAELSVDAYEPSAPIWRQVVADQPDCLFPGCQRPATCCELDHHTEYPEGDTCTANLGPFCRRHHKTKHARGYRLVRNDDGSHTLYTRFGSTFHLPKAEQPVCTWVDATAGRETATAA